jgi:hypothetical protein
MPHLAKKSISALIAAATVAAPLRHPALALKPEAFTAPLAPA